MAVRQLSLLAAGVLPARIEDLEGWLAGPGQLVVRGPAARLAVRVGADQPWRVAALSTQLTEAHLSAEVARVAASPAALSVRTAFTVELATMAARWRAGSTKRVPADFALDGARLRSWFLAAGGLGADGDVELGLGPGEEAVWAALGGALAGLGFAPVLHTGSARRPGAPAYRLVGRRRRARLAELLGEPPEGWPQGQWP